MPDATDSDPTDRAVHRDDFDALAHRLARHHLDAGSLADTIGAFAVAVPSWALGTGGTRFGRFPGTGEPRNVFEKLDDCAQIHRLTGATPTVSLHIPWDEPDDPAELCGHAEALGLSFDAVNSNTFQNAPDAAETGLSYKFGSFSHPDAAVRYQAVEHNLHVIEVGKALGSDAITVWLADGTNYPGQASLRRSYDRVLASLEAVYDGLPDDWRLFTEHKPYEPAFYSTVVQDWGTSLMLANTLGPNASCLVDLGHHLPNTNVELVVARLLSAGKLGGFHFNDSKYGDDDLTAGSIKPYQLFLVFHELVQAAREAEAKGEPFAPAYMIDQSHNLKDPIEAILQTVDQLQQAYAKALLVDHAALATYQNDGDVLMAERAIKAAYETDVRPLVAEARRRKGGALDPIATFRAGGYRERVAASRASGAYTPPQSL